MNATYFIGDGSKLTGIVTDFSPAFNQANTSYTVANNAYDKANAANLLAFNTGTGANAYLLTVIAGANSAVGTGANSYAATVGTSANTYLLSVISGANTAVGTGANTYLLTVIAGANSAVGTGANSYAATVGTSANAYAAAIANTIAITAYNKANSANYYTYLVDANATAAFTRANSAAKLTISDTAPASGNANGDQWWSSTLGKMFIYYADVDSSQWVESSTNMLNVQVGVVGYGIPYDMANTANLNAKTAQDRANTAYNQANTSYNQANTAYTVANNAYGKANSALANTTVTLSGTLTVTGNIGIGGINPTSNKLQVLGSSSASIETLTDAATITPDFSSNNAFTVTINGNRTIANPNNITAGQSGIIYIIQGIGSNTISWGSYWKFPSNTAPTLSTANGAIDAVIYYTRTTTSITSQVLLNIG